MKFTTHQAERDILQTTVAYVGGSRRRAFDAVVIQIDHFNPTKPKRSVVLRTSGALHPDIDKARMRRLCRRLRAAGVSFTTDARCHPLNGIGGTWYAQTH
ncbi:hypothetical protein [Duganella vulcania]|uniref:Uncharacterized protein n=1 Tax=Duganella vulcania TaxID=2692166 RepID=A0A845GGS1_9BURK|nr:hypothetical protein [Duganella vulcania]MYM92595.1 hypothetical protein [Duganella vulcania]